MKTLEKLRLTSNMSQAKFNETDVDGSGDLSPDELIPIIKEVCCLLITTFYLSPP